MQRLQENYIQIAVNQYLPRLTAIMEANGRLLAETLEKKRLASADLQKLYDTNIKSQELTAESAEKYKQLLSHNIERMVYGKKRTEAQIVFVINSYKTIESAASLIALMNESENAFNSLADLEVPELIAFDAEDLKEFQNLTMKLKNAA